METIFKNNGNALIDGQEFVPLARLEAGIDEAIKYNRRKAIINSLIVVVLVIAAFLIGLAV